MFIALDNRDELHNLDAHDETKSSSLNATCEVNQKRCFVSIYRWHARARCDRAHADPLDFLN